MAADFVLDGLLIQSYEDEESWHRATVAANIKSNLTNSRFGFWCQPWAKLGNSKATDAEVLLYALLVLIEANGDPISIELFCRECAARSRIQRSPTLQLVNESVAPVAGVARSNKHIELESPSVLGTLDSSKRGPYKAGTKAPLQYLSKGVALLFSEARQRNDHSKSAFGPKPLLPPIANDVAGQVTMLTDVLRGYGGCPMWQPEHDCVASRVVTSAASLHPYNSRPPNSCSPPLPSELDLQDSQLVGQRELYATSFIPKGKLIPWYSNRLRLEDEPPTEAEEELAPYEFQFKHAGQNFVATPDPRFSTCFVNDFLGPERNSQRRRRLSHTQNMRFCVVHDIWKRPYVFVMATKDVAQGCTCRIDYGDEYWRNWHLNKASLSRAFVLHDISNEEDRPTNKALPQLSSPTDADAAHLRCSAVVLKTGRGVGDNDANDGGDLGDATLGLRREPDACLAGSSSGVIDTQRSSDSSIDLITPPNSGLEDPGIDVVADDCRSGDPAVPYSTKSGDSKSSDGSNRKEMRRKDPSLDSVERRMIQERGGINDGVSWCESDKKWHAHITIDGKKTDLGSFDDGQAAVRKYDEFAKLLGKPSPLKSQGHDGGSGGKRPDFSSITSSRFTGVSWNQQNQKWIAQICSSDKKSFLDSLDSEVDAARECVEPLNSASAHQKCFQARTGTTSLSKNRASLDVSEDEISDDSNGGSSRNGSIGSVGDIGTSKWSGFADCGELAKHVLRAAFHNGNRTDAEITAVGTVLCGHSVQDDLWEDNQSFEELFLPLSEAPSIDILRAYLTDIMVDIGGNSTTRASFKDAEGKSSRTLAALPLIAEVLRTQGEDLWRHLCSLRIGSFAHPLTGLTQQPGRAASLTNEVLSPVESMRQVELKAVVLEAKVALLKAGVPRKRKHNNSAPFYYQAHSSCTDNNIPWNEGKKRAMTPAEGISWLSAELVEQREIHEKMLHRYEPLRAQQPDSNEAFGPSSLSALPSSSSSFSSSITSSSSAVDDYSTDHKRLVAHRYDASEGKGSCEFSSKFYGVTYNKRDAKWTASLYLNSNKKYLGTFDSEEDAARKYDEHAILQGKPLNFPVEGQLRAVKGLTSKQAAQQAKKRQKGGTSVCAKSSDEEDNLEGKEAGLTESNEALLPNVGKASLFQPEKEKEEDSHAQSSTLPFGIRRPVATRYHASEGRSSCEFSSNFTGVTWNKKDAKWNASFYHKSKNYYLGSFDNEEDAAHKYDEEAILHGKPVNFPVEGQTQAVKGLKSTQAAQQAKKRQEGGASVCAKSSDEEDNLEGKEAGLSKNNEALLSKLGKASPFQPEEEEEEDSHAQSSTPSFGIQACGSWAVVEIPKRAVVSSASGDDVKYHGQGIYVGQHYNGLMSGLGHFVVSENGDNYVGEWREGCFHGLGIFTWAATGCTFSGFFHHGAPFAGRRELKTAASVQYSYIYGSFVLDNPEDHSDVYEEVLQFTQAARAKAVVITGMLAVL